MSKELQPDDGGYLIEQDEPLETEDQEEREETPDPDSESATDSGNSAHEKQVEFTEEQQKVFNDAVGKKVFKLREKERESEALRRRLEELEARIPQQGRPQVPDWWTRRSMRDLPAGRRTAARPIPAPRLAQRTA